MEKNRDLELTILMPCLNEEKTVALCVEKANGFLRDNHIDGEVMVADNGSTDGSAAKAADAGAVVIHEARKGYGLALMAGIEASHGKYIIMGDADDSYDMYELMPILDGLRSGYKLVMGDRFAGRMEPDAMPFFHRWIGNPLLSGLGRLISHSSIHDFHCGLRGFEREAILALSLSSEGFEFASEMVIKSEKAKLAIAQIPISYKKDGRSGPSHIRPIRDGLRHLGVLVGGRR